MSGYSSTLHNNPGWVRVGEEGADRNHQGSVCRERELVRERRTGWQGRYRRIKTAHNRPCALPKELRGVLDVRKRKK